MHVLILEDTAADLELMKRELRKGGLDSTVHWASDKGAFLAALEAPAPDLILADYSLPGFDGLTAMALARQRWPDVPVIIVSGAIGEEVAIEALKAGATDYVLKQRLGRLGPVARRALHEAEEVAQRKRAQTAIREAHEKLQEQAEELESQAEELRAQTEELAAANTALRELNVTLESKVAQRTAELQHRAQQLQKLALELSETEDRERRQLAEVLHDDLQQQLAAAKFHLDLLRNRAKHDPSQQAIIDHVSQMLLEAVQKSRSLSHELSPAVLYHMDFGGALTWLANQVRTKHGLEVTVDAFGEVRVESDAIKSFLYKAAQELVFNVVKHARVHHARIRVRRLGQCICLSVSDRGRGFDPQAVRQAKGFGLLSIRERIELLGGRMKIHSILGHGSTFHVVVPDGVRGLRPVTRDPGGVGANNHSPLRATDHEPRATLRVLLADDHAIVREGLLSLLSETTDIEVVGEAANGREAINQAYRLRPDVVVMDVAMPLINGDDATRQIKIHLPRTRVIALSMYEDADLVEKMHRAGAENYILKTAPSEELLAAIRGQGAGARTGES